MKQCPNCHLEIWDQGANCPLCKGQLMGELSSNKKELYPKIANVKQESTILKFLVLLSLCLSLIALWVNSIVKNEFHWSFLFILGIIYCWIIALYSIKKNINIGGHVVLQTITISILAFLLDVGLGYEKWSVNYVIPMAIGIANIAMFLLLLINKRKYIKYVIYQIILLIGSMVPLSLFLLHIATKTTSTVFSLIASVTVFVISLFVCGKAIRSEIKRRFYF